MAEADYTGVLRVHSDDPVYPVMEIPLSGRGIHNECPEALVQQGEMNVRPLDVITLDGTPSVDVDGPDGRPLNYEWVVIQRPEGSTCLLYTSPSPRDRG